MASNDSITYTPPPTVKDFIKHFLPAQLFLDWIIGPVGSGKTTGIFMKLVRMAMLQAPNPADGIRRTRCVVVRNTAQQLKDTTIKSWDMWFKDGQAGKWFATDKTFLLKFADVECEVMFRPLDTPDDVQRVLSLEVTFAIIDEFVQIPQAIIESISGRCGRYPPAKDGGATNWGVWGASNPGMETDWWYAYLEDHEQLPEDTEPPDNWKYWKQPSGFADGSPKFGGVKAENVRNLAPYTDDNAYYLNLAKGKSASWIKQFIETEWGYTQAGKPVFPMFRKEIHVSEKPLLPNRVRPLLIGYDPGLTGSGFVIGQYDDSVGQVRVYAEIVLENYATDRAIIDKLKPLLTTPRFRGIDVVVIPDPASANGSQSQQGNSVLRELKKHFEVSKPNDNSIEGRVGSMQAYMMRLTPDGPALIIDPCCVNLIRALTAGYRYALLKDGETKEKPDKNKHSHVADAGMYITLHAHKVERDAGRRAAAPVRRQAHRTSYFMR